jgi:RimJ/RimL family protein N-acetyltransferase
MFMLWYDDGMSDSLDAYFSSHDLKMRHVNDADVDTLVDIINEAYSYQDVAKGEPRTNPDHLRKRIKETDFYLIEDSREIIGCVYLEPEEPVLHFGLLTLVPSYRGRGIAEDIMKAINTYAENNKFQKINLDYMSLAPWLKAYYEKYGYVETGQVIKWGKIDLIQMSKPLHP